jgi:hypothetical protein
LTISGLSIRPSFSTPQKNISALVDKYHQSGYTIYFYNLQDDLIHLHLGIDQTKAHYSHHQEPCHIPRPCDTAFWHLGLSPNKEKITPATDSSTVYDSLR